MKRILISIFLAALCSSMAFGQFIAGPRPGNAVPVTTPYQFVHITYSTNIANPVSYPLESGKQLKFFVDMAATNASYNSNVWFFFQVSRDGTKWMDSVEDAAGPQISVMMPLNGTTARTRYTNLLSEALLDSVKFIRLETITNAATVTTQSFWITNMYFLQ